MNILTASFEYACGLLSVEFERDNNEVFISKGKRSARRYRAPETDCVQSHENKIKETLNLDRSDYV